LKYKVLIVGLGNIAIGYDLFDKDQDCIKTHARAFDMHNSFSLQGGVDCNAKSRKLFEDNYHAPSYTDLDDALVDINPDLVVVSTPTVLHLGNVEVIIKHSSVKVILCEKPLSYHIKEAQEMVRLCSTNKIKLYVNFIRRVDPAVIKIKEWIDSRKIGKPIKGVVWYSKGLIHNGSHFIDLLKHWFGPIQSSFIIDNGQKLSQGDVEADFKLNFKDVSMIFTATREEFFSHYTIELISPNGRLRYDRGGKLVIWQDRSSNAQGNQAKVLLNNETVIKSNLSKYQMNVVNQLNMVIKGQDSYLCTGEQALELSKDIFSIIKKIKYV